MAAENKAIISEYDFDEDAMGLGNFIDDTFENLSYSEIVVYVTDDEGRMATKATFERELLTDDSAVVNMIIRILIKR